MQARKPATQAYLIHDRDSFFARRLDSSIKNLGMTLLRSPPHSVKANAISIRPLHQPLLKFTMPTCRMIQSFPILAR